jgi:hypothetical protein
MVVLRSPTLWLSQLLITCGINVMQVKKEPKYPIRLVRFVGLEVVLIIKK